MIPPLLLLIQVTTIITITRTKLVSREIPKIKPLRIKTMMLVMTRIVSTVTKVSSTLLPLTAGTMRIVLLIPVVNKAIQSSKTLLVYSRILLVHSMLIVQAMIVIVMMVERIVTMMMRAHLLQTLPPTPVLLQPMIAMAMLQTRTLIARIILDTTNTMIVISIVMVARIMIQHPRLTLVGKGVKRIVPKVRAKVSRSRDITKNQN